AFLALMVPLLAACGDNEPAAPAGGERSNQPAATAKPADLPAGWKPFNEGDYSGGIAPTWEATLINGAELLKPGSTAADSLPKDFRDQVVAAAQQGKFKETLFIFLSKTPGKATNINLLSCLPGTQLLSELEKQYDAGTVKHSSAGTVPYAGKQTPLIQVEVGAAFDTYQAIAQGETCYTVVTLTVVKGDPDRLGDFRKFMGALQLKK
ncbi:MAG: hypothetical protein ABIP13_05265, partial [Tepidiformaceae bacterium]